MTSQAFNQAFDTTVCLAGVLFLTGSYFVHCGCNACDSAPNQDKASRAGREWPLMPENRLRRAAVLLSASLFIAEDALLIRNEPDVLVIENHLIATAYFACAWLLVLCRNRLIVKETLGLSLISILYCMPARVLDFHSIFKFPEPCLCLRSVMALTLAGLAFDCLFQFTASRRAVKLGLESVPSAGESNEKDSSKEKSRNNADDGSDSDSDDSDSDSETDTPAKKQPQNDQAEKDETWTEYYARFKPLLQCLIPAKDNYYIQFCYLTSWLVLFGGRYLNVLLPTYGATITDKVFAGEFPFMELAIYCGLNLIKSSVVQGIIDDIVNAEIRDFSYYRLVRTPYLHVMNLDMNFHVGNSTTATNSSMGGCHNLCHTYSELFGILIPAILDGAMAIVVLYDRFNPSIALVTGIASCAYVCLRMYAATLYVASRRKSNNARTKQWKVMDESIRGWPSVASFNMFEYWQHRFDRYLRTYLRKDRDYQIILAYVTAGCELFFPTVYLALSALILVEMHAGRATPGDFVFFVQYWDRICSPMRRVASFYRYILDSLIDAEKTCDLLAKKPKVTDKEGASTLSNVKGQIQLENAVLSFGKKTALNGVTLSVSPGEMIGIVGSTGAGKSSLMNVIRRVYDVNSGKVMIDGQDVRDVTQSSLSNSISVVPQQPFFFNTTIMKNLRYAQPSATDEEIYDACRAACVHDQIIKFPKGYKSIVGDNGIKLSGGEQQRIAIACALLRKAPIMILDEATSAVDTETEQHIQAALKNIHGKHTTFVVAHRLSTITRSNQIIVLEDGKIIEQGTHKELRDNGGKYSRLWKAMVDCLNDDD